MEITVRVFSLLLIICSLPLTLQGAEPVSHPRLRPNPSVAKRAMGKGPSYFVDAKNGDDNNDGSKAAPWEHVSYAVTQLKAGDTLYLRGGSYFENVTISLFGTKDKPIVVRSYPGEQAILDGGIAEFQRSPDVCWEPVSGGGEGEYRSVKTYPNIRDVVGAFGDSDVGLQTYWHTIDLRSPHELSKSQPGADVRPVYCGPGIYYDRLTSRIHVRLAHTHFKHFENYAGETDPRQLPLVIAPFRSTVLHVDQGKHLKFQDLILRGGGYETVVVESGVDIDFDNVTIRGGTYCMRTNNTQQLRFYRSAMYGNAPPWSFRGDGSLRNRPGRNLRDIARLTCHALWTTDSGREFSVYAMPCNDDWEIAYSEFTDSHDGLYLGGINCRFHHNVIDSFQDDGIYLSQMYPRHLYHGDQPKLEIYENLFQRALTPIAFGGMEDTRDNIYIYRNLFDLRGGVNYQRPSEEKPDVTPFAPTRALSDHGSPPWPEMKIYHNTFYTRGGSGALSVPSAAREGHPRFVFNNLFYHEKSLGALSRLPAPEFAQLDGNLYWSPGAEKAGAVFFNRFRKSAAFEASKQNYAPGWTTHSIVADPKLMRTTDDLPAPNDYRLRPGSPAINAGVAIPKEWPDSLRQSDAGKPDIGALPAGAKEFKAGRE